MTTDVASQQEGGTPWWLVLIQGIAAFVVGMLLLTSPRASTVVLVQVLGVYWLIAGLFSIVSIFLDSSGWGLKLVSGVVGVLAGLLIVQHPLWSALVLPATAVLLLGFGGIIIGVVYLIQAFGDGGWGIGTLGAISIIFGIIVLAGNTLMIALSLPLVVGIFGVIGGIMAVFQAFRMR